MKIIVLLLVMSSALAFAQPGGSGSAPAPAPGSGTATPAPPPETPPPAPPSTDAASARKACTDAMNADPSFAKAIVEATDQHAAQVRLKLDLEQHEKAAAAIAKNQKHVVLAYAAMWIIAAGFVMFLWRRQAALKLEIAQLKTDLDAATKDTRK